jgi:hypothetical protein
MLTGPGAGVARYDPAAAVSSDEAFGPMKSVSDRFPQLHLVEAAGCRS